MSKKTLPKELGADHEARGAHAEARKTERARLAGIAAAQAIRGPVPPAAKGRSRYVVSADCVTPDGKHHRPGEVISVPDRVEPSMTWDSYEDRLEREKTHAKKAEAS